MEIVGSVSQAPFLTDEYHIRYIDETLKQDNARFDSSLFTSGPAPSSLVPSQPPLSEPSRSNSMDVTERPDVFDSLVPVERIPSTSNLNPRVSAISLSSLDSLLRSAAV